VHRHFALTCRSSTSFLFPAVLLDTLAPVVLQTTVLISAKAAQVWDRSPCLRVSARLCVTFAPSCWHLLLLTTGGAHRYVDVLIFGINHMYHNVDAYGNAVSSATCAGALVERRLFVLPCLCRHETLFAVCARYAGPYLCDVYDPEGVLVSCRAVLGACRPEHVPVGPPCESSHAHPIAHRRVGFRLRGRRGSGCRRVASSCTTGAL
jgi:hypothetical protein